MGMGNGIVMQDMTSFPGEAEPDTGLTAMPRRVGSDVMLTLIPQIVHARSMEEAWSAGVDAFRLIGFHHVIYGYSPDSRGINLGSPEDYLVLTTLEREHVNTLVSREHHRSSVTFNWALRNSGVVSWSHKSFDSQGNPDFQPTDEALTFFERVGLNSGCSVGFAETRTRGIGAMALSLKPDVSQEAFDVILPDLSASIYLLATVMHRALISLPWHRPSGSLTARQREVLEWVGEGKTTADIACIMNLTPATVEKHLRLARQCLRVDTTAHALVKATFLNQVYVGGDGRGDQG